MMDTDKMSAVEFGKWLLCQHGIDAMAIISRDAYRERQALEAAVERADKWMRKRDGSGLSESLRAAILGTPAFVKGQLVVDGRNGKIWPWEDAMVESSNRYWPLKAHIDDSGRVIVED